MAQPENYRLSSRSPLHHIRRSKAAVTPTTHATAPKTNGDVIIAVSAHASGAIPET